MSDQNVRFIRKNGRVIPIRSKEERRKLPTPDQVGSAAASGALAGGAVYGGVRGVAAKFGVKASRLQSIIKRFTPDVPPAKPLGPPTLTKSGKLSKRKGRGLADIFEQAEYSKKLGSYNKRMSRLGKLKVQAEKITKITKFTRKSALPLAALTFVAGGVTSYLND